MTKPSWKNWNPGKISWCVKTAGKMDKEQAMENRRIQAAAKIWIDYIAALDQIAPALTAPDVCFKTISDYNTENGKVSSPFTVAYNRCMKLQTILKHDDAPFIWTWSSAPSVSCLNMGPASPRGYSSSDGRRK